MQKLCYKYIFVIYNCVIFRILYEVRHSCTFGNGRKVVDIVEITDIRVRKINAEGKMKAVVSVTFDNAIVIHDIKIIEGQEKLFIAMPSRKTPDGEFKDIAHPINAQMRQSLEDAILDKYETALTEEPTEVDPIE